MSTSDAFVTLVTSDSYVPGALALASSLRTSGSLTRGAFTVALCSGPGLRASSVSLLHRGFDFVCFVSPLVSGHKDSKDNLVLLGRPELASTFTKLHCFDPKKVRGADRVVFLDADVLVTKDISLLFDRLNNCDFAAAPDVGWPDIFNSGVFVTRTNKDIFDALCWDAKHAASFDGGDQGLLNAFFDTWATGSEPTDSYSNPTTIINSDGNTESRPYCDPGIKRAARLPFIFNVTPSAVYSYAPAFKQFKHNVAIIHFAGHTKPWAQIRRFTDGSVWNK
ncbi:hypothetical protein HDU98_002876 [Podochytrium sp. JEL0797]|nr:hypothetical protein HDU98_002876 [Podochytrium sp. JEL0797]